MREIYQNVCPEVPGNPRDVIFPDAEGGGKYGSGSVILLRPKIGLAPQKHDVISMPRQQYTNTKHIPIESYHPVVSIMPRHMDPKKIFGQNLCCREVKIDKISGGDLPYFSLKCDNLP